VDVEIKAIKSPGNGKFSNNGYDWLSGLNDEQKAAATHSGGPLLIVAGAGTGKTKTLAYRVAHLISTGVRAEGILLLTFTRKASEEMLRRAYSAVYGKESAGSVWGGTFHSIANRLLRIYSRAAGLLPDFTIVDQGDAEDMLDVLREELSLDKKEARFPRKSTCLAIYSRRVNGNDELEGVLKRYYPWCLRWKDELNALFRRYVEEKTRQNVLDYDDLLLYLYYLLEDEEMSAEIEGRFDAILVDEYQDTNPIQAGILERLRRTNKNITVVGDDAQSIYSFRSATVKNMLDFPARFPGAVIMKLECNYRSAGRILACTNVLISQAGERYTKNLYGTRDDGALPELVTCRDERAQDEAVIERVLRHYEEGIPLRSQAVLFRASSHSASLELALSRKNIPFVKYGGLRFLEAAHIKDLVGFLRVLENPKDERAWFRILQLIRGVGPSTASAAIRHLIRENYRVNSLASFNGAEEITGQLKKLADLLDQIAGCAVGPGIEIERINEYYAPLLREKYDNHRERENDIVHLAGLASGYSSRREFLTELVLDPPVFTGDLAGPPIRDEDYLILSTIHSAKGLEWDAVYLIHAADGCLPSDLSTGSSEEIDEELRLAYVAMTRARNHLYILWPQRFYSRPSGLSDNHVYAQLSRFFNDEVLATVSRSSTGTCSEGAERPAEAGKSVEIQKKLKEMWGG
jgi:DNA helicase-2/ATP-dependent DNA helicase PcrA